MQMGMNRGVRPRRFGYWGAKTPDILSGDRTRTMLDGYCPHCGDKFPLVRDGFCATCRQPLDEPPEVPRSPEEQRAYRSQLEEEAKQNLRLLALLGRLFHWF